MRKSQVGISKSFLGEYSMSTERSTDAKTEKMPSSFQVKPGKDPVRTYTVAEQESHQLQWDCQNLKTESLASSDSFKLKKPQ